MNITLTDYELEMAAGVGIRRRIQSISQQLTQDSGFRKQNAWTIDIEGALAECAAAKALGIYWDGSVNTFKAADLGSGLQVRHSELENGCLIVRPKDKDTEDFVLVVGKAPRYRVVGWINAKRAKDPKFLKDYADRAPAYFVPQSELKSITTLKQIMQQHTGHA